MSTVPPPLDQGPRAAAERSVARAAGVAKVSSGVMLVLGALSMLASIRAPLGASFAISVAVFGNGWIERHFARRLAAQHAGAPMRLALNQAGLGLEVMAYAAWQAYALGPAQIEAVLRRPAIGRLLAALDPAVVERPLGLLPAGVKLHPVTAHVVEISSSEIRSRLAAGRPVRWFLPAPVADLIESANLYR